MLRKMVNKDEKILNLFRDKLNACGIGRIEWGANWDSDTDFKVRSKAIIIVCSSVTVMGDKFLKIKKKC